jgi:hypothetical protein
VTVPTRDWPEFLPTTIATDPLPVPDEGGAIASQSALATALHAHPAAVITFTFSKLPLASTVRLVGAIPYAHVIVGGAACDTVNVWPAIVSVPVRAALVVFAAALKPTVPLPVPDVGAITVSQSALFEVADHAHPAVVVIIVDPLPPVSGMGWDVGEIE